MRPTTIGYAGFLVSAAACTLFACHGDEEQRRTTTGSLAVCGDVTLRVARMPQRAHIGLAADANPKIVVDLAAAPSADRTVVSAKSCGAGVPTTSATVTGHDGFVVDPTMYADARATGCMVLTAISYAAGFPTHSAEAMLLFGDYTLTGSVVAQTSPSPAPMAANLEVLVGETTLPTTSGPDGVFKIAHLPAGTVFRVAARGTGPGGAPFDGAALPRAVLDAAHPTAVVDVSTYPTVPIADRFEPDDTIANVGNRPVFYGGREYHVLSTKQDVDVVPIALTQGARYRIAVVPARPGSVDVGLVVTTSTGTVLAHANDSPADFAPDPAMELFASLSTLAYVKLTRTDDEPVTLPFFVTFTRVGSTP